MADFYFHLDKLTVGYNGHPLISDIEIGINKGEIVTLIGPNGAGKSTILKSISRQLEIIGGGVEFDGKDIRDYSYRDLSCRMAVVLTDRLKPELMTCHDIVATGRYPYTGRLGILSKEDEQIVENAMKAVHAEDLGMRDFNAISDGQKQRVLLARAICQEPDIILLDEPTSFLDIRHKLELLAILRDMAKSQDITVIMSLHEIDLAMKISDRILCIKGDHIFMEGSPDDVFKEDLIRDLYSIDNGYFDTTFGSIEMPKPEGEPDVLVISSGGCGIPVYRRLQKEGRAFIAGIFGREDIDCQVARLLASEVISADTGAPLGEEAKAQAVSAVDRCSEVIEAGSSSGRFRDDVAEILKYAEEKGKLKRIGQ